MCNMGEKICLKNKNSEPRLKLFVLIKNKLVYAIAVIFDLIIEELHKLVEKTIKSIFNIYLEGI